MPLFRALRLDEIANGYVLVPKTQMPFLAHPRLPFTFPLVLGETEAHALREHQWDSKFPTRGVSCTLNWQVALRYAAESRVIVRIDETACDRLKIRRLRVLDHVPLALVLHPEDDEVVLVSDDPGALPREVIAEVFAVADDKQG